MVQSASLDIDASWFVMTSKVKGHGDIGHFGYLSHFGRKISPLCPRKPTKIPWNFKTRVQELTSDANRMFLSLFVWIWKLFKDQMVWGSFCSVNFKGNFDYFYKLPSHLWKALKSKRFVTNKDKNMRFAPLVSSWALFL